MEMLNSIIIAAGIIFIHCNNVFPVVVADLLKYTILCVPSCSPWLRGKKNWVVEKKKGKKGLHREPQRSTEDHRDS